MKIPLLSLGPWEDRTKENIGRVGRLNDGAEMDVSIWPRPKGSFIWRLYVQDGSYHSDLSDSMESAQRSADAYLAEHFELPVSLEDKLKAAEKRIEELEKQTSNLRYYFLPGQRVYVKGLVEGEGYEVETVQVFRDQSALYTLKGFGYQYRESQLTAVPS